MKEVDEENVPGFILDACGFCKNPSQPPVTYSTKFPQVEKQIRSVTAPLRTHCEHRESFQQSKNKIEYLFGLVNRLH